MKVGYEADKVVLECRRFQLLTPLQAANLAGALEEAALKAEPGPLSMVVGDTWSVKITSYDKRVVLEVYPPLLARPTSQSILCPMPVSTARAIARELTTTAEAAGYNMRIEVRNVQ